MIALIKYCIDLKSDWTLPGRPTKRGRSLFPLLQRILQSHGTTAGGVNSSFLLRAVLFDKLGHTVVAIQISRAALRNAS